MPFRRGRRRLGGPSTVGQAGWSIPRCRVVYPVHGKPFFSVNNIVLSVFAHECVPFRFVRRRSHAVPSKAVGESTNRVVSVTCRYGTHTNVECVRFG